MGKRILILMLMLSVAGSLLAVPWADRENTALLSAATGPVNYWGMDNPEPDTIRYDDFGTTHYWWPIGSYYVSTRFTPQSDFELRSAYVMETCNDATLRYNVWVTGDIMVGTLHTPDDAVIHTELLDLTPTIGNLIIEQIDFIDSVSFFAGEDFHIVIGPLAANDPSPRFNTWLDAGSQGYFRSLYTTLWPTGAVFDLVAGTNYDWRIRAGGEYVGDYTDATVTNVVNDSAKYFFCPSTPVTFGATVENLGTLAIPNYDVKWVVRDGAGVLSDSIQGSYTNLGIGVEANIVAPSAWNESAVGSYIVTCTILAPGDATPDNDDMLFEEYVYDPTLSTLLTYTESPFPVGLTMDPGEGYAMQYDACSYPVEITHLEIEPQTAGAAAVRVYGDDGTGNLDPTAVLYDSTVTLALINNIIPLVPPVPIASGPFYVAYINTGTVDLSVPMDDDPNAGANPVTSVRWSTNDNGATFDLVLGADHPLAARINPFGGTIRDVGVDWMTFPGFFGPGSDPFEGQIQVRNNGTEADTFDVSLTIEDTAFARTVVFSETQTVTNLAVGDSAELTYGSYNFPGIGEYILTAEAIAPGDANPSDNVLMAEHQTCLYPSELTYDDGDFENGWAFFDPGNFWGALFAPPFYPCKITDMRLNFSTVPAGFDNARAQIIGPDQTTLWYDYEDPAVVVGWNSYSPGDILVMDSYFYAGTEWITGAPDAPYFSTDETEPISLMARQRITGVWYFDVEDPGVRVTVDAAVMSPIVITRTGGSRNLDMQLSWTFAGTAGTTWYFIYESSTPYGTYALVDSVLHPAQSWSETNLPEVKKFYYVTFGDASGSRDNTLPGQYLWQPFEMTASSNSAIEPGVIRAPRGVADRR